MYNLKEQFFSEELSRIYQREKREKQYQDLEFKKRVKQELRVLEEKEDKKKFFSHFDILKKIRPKKILKNIERNFLTNSEYKKSDNLATRIPFSFYYDGASEAAIEEPEVLPQGEEAGAVPEAEEDEGARSEDFEKEQLAERAKQAAISAGQKKLQHERALAKMQKIAQQAKRIKTALSVLKIGSALGGLVSLGLTLLVTILIWIGQFIGHYLLGIQIVPGYDWLDYLLMFIVAFLLAIILLPIIIFLALVCEVDIFGLVC